MAAGKVWRRILIRAVFLLLGGILTLIVGCRVLELGAMNEDGIAEAKDRIDLVPELKERLGEPIRYGRVWHGSYDWFRPGGGEMEVYVPVNGSKSSGVLYLKDFNDIGAWKLREMKFKPAGQKDWIEF
jgi:hypothetical protein